MVSIESLLQQLQNGGKKSIKRKPAAAKPVRARSASPVRRKAKPVKRRVFPKMRRSIGGFFEELNNMVAGQGPEKKDKTPVVAGTVNPAATPMAPPATGAMGGGRYRVFKKKVATKKPLKKPKRRMTFGGYEGEEVAEAAEAAEAAAAAEAEEAEMEQEGGRRRVFKKKPKRRPTSRGRMSYGGYEEEALGGRPRRPRARSASPARRRAPARRVRH
jgi:hypothetical protein